MSIFHVHPILYNLELSVNCHVLQLFSVSTLLRHARTPNEYNLHGTKSIVCQ